MRTDIRHKNLQIDSPLRDRVRQRLLRRLDRLSREITLAAVHLEDVNGPRGGVDKRCLLEVTAPRVGTIVAGGEGTSVGAAVNEALRSASALMESKMQGMLPGGLSGLVASYAARPTTWG